MLTQLVVAGLPAEVGQRLRHIGRRDFVPARCRRRLTGGREPQRVGVEREQARRLGRGVAELEAQLDGGELGSGSGHQQITITDGVQGAGAAEGAADFVAPDGFAHVVDHDEGGAGSFA